MATPLEIKNSIRSNLSGLVDRTSNWSYLSLGIEETIVDLVWEVKRLLDIVEVPLDTSEIEEQISLKAAPFQPECKCKVVQSENGDLTIYHCQYHRSIAYVYDELVSILEVEHIATRQDLAIGLLSFISECKKNSLTGRVSKARDENVGR